MADETSMNGPTTSVDIAAPPAADGFVELDLELIKTDTDNIRDTDDSTEVTALIENIERNGLLHPLVVYPSPDEPGMYTISAGHRRFCAVLNLGWPSVPVNLIEPPTDDLQRLDLMAAENLQRRQLDPIERAHLFKRYLDRGLRQTDIAKRLGITDGAVSQVLPMLALPPEIQAKIKRREIGYPEAVKLAVKHRNENTEKPHGLYGRVRASGVQIPFFNSQHPLAAQARDLCIGSAHATRHLIGGACGSCWESTIRRDALSDNPTKIPDTKPPVQYYKSPATSSVCSDANDAEWVGWNARTRSNASSSATPTASFRMVTTSRSPSRLVSRDVGRGADRPAHPPHRSQPPRMGASMRGRANTVTDFRRLIDRSGGTDACWLWQGQTNRGYGVFRLGPTKRRAHRIAYELAYGPIGDGMHVDHLCNVAGCCNPLHLEAVTPAENSRRGCGVRGFRRTHCRNGHPFTASNTYTSRDGKRRCRACIARAKEKWRLKQSVAP